MVYVGSSTSLPSPDADPVNGQDYYYKVFAQDTAGNYAVGVQTGPHTPAPAGTTVGTVSAVVDACNQVTVTTTFTDVEPAGIVTVPPEIAT